MSKHREGPEPQVNRPRSHLPKGVPTFVVPRHESDFLENVKAILIKIEPSVAVRGGQQLSEIIECRTRGEWAREKGQKSKEIVKTNANRHTSVHVVFSIRK